MDWDQIALSLAVFLPLAGALVLMGYPKGESETGLKAVALVTTLATAAVGVYLLVNFDYDQSDKLQFVTDRSWIEVINSRYHIGIDGISLPLLMLSMLITVLCVIYSWDHFPEPHNPKAFLALMLILETGMNGTFVAQDLILFFVFFEVVLLPMYFMIGVWGGPNRQYAAIKFFLFTLFGSALMILGFLALYFKGGNTFDIPELIANASDIASGTQMLIFGGLFIGFAIKVPMFPFHTWLPDAHTEAPTAGSVILAGVLLKMGTYGLLRFGLFLFPKAAVDLAPLLLTLAVIGIIYGALVATMQKDLKRLVAYSSVAHLGFIVLGTFAFTSQGLSGGVLQMVNHGLSTGALFLLVGMIYDRRHTRLISELRGLQKPAPVLAAVFMVVMLSSIGLPGLNGFVGEFLVLIGTFVTRRWFAVVAAAGVILAAIYLLWAYQRVFHGAPDEANASIPDMTWRERATMAPLVLLIVLLGVYPKPVLDRINPSVDRLLDHVEQRTGERQPAVAEAHGVVDE